MIANNSVCIYIYIYESTNHRINRKLNALDQQCKKPTINAVDARREGF